ncbi:23825_t:CDS:1, partial [Racocetra persica]
TYEPVKCKPYLLTATHDKVIKGQMTFYQSSNGSIVVTGTYQYGFNNPCDWCYTWSIQNQCGEVVYNFTDLYTEYATKSGCDGYPPDHKCKKRVSILMRGDKHDKCYIGEWGTKPWVLRFNNLIWDCDHKGIKHKTCEGKKIYDEWDEKHKVPKRLKDQGSPTGLFLVIKGYSKSGKRVYADDDVAPVNDYED